MEVFKSLTDSIQSNSVACNKNMFDDTAYAVIQIFAYRIKTVVPCFLINHGLVDVVYGFFTGFHKPSGTFDLSFPDTSHIVSVFDGVRNDEFLLNDLLLVPTFRVDGSDRIGSE